MKDSDAAVVLALCATFDQRTIGRLDAAAWGRVLGDMSVEDCCAAVDAWYAAHRERIMPADVVSGARAITRRRIGRQKLADRQATIAAENGGDADLEPVTDGGPKAPLALDAGPLHQRLDDVQAGRRDARERFAAQREADAEAARRREERNAKRAEILAELHPGAVS